MKSLLDIQQDIRNLENSVKDITDSIRNISSDIDNIRNASADSAELTLDYKKIEALAKQVIFKKHPLSELKQPQVERMYLDMLLNIVRLDADDDAAVNRMVFIQWLKMQSHVDFTLEELYIGSFKLDKKLYYDFVDSLPTEYREYFVVDALIIANISGKANSEIYEYIAQIASILGIPADEMRALALIAKVALCQDVEGLDREQLLLIDGKMKKYRHYISSILDDIIKSLRAIVVNVPDSGELDFEWCVKQHEKVKRGDVIAKTKKREPKRSLWCISSMAGSTEKPISTEYLEIKAPVSGTIFQFKVDDTNYGAISSCCDNGNLIREHFKLL